MLIIHTKSSNYTFRSLSLSFKLTFTCHSNLLTHHLLKSLLQETWSFCTKYQDVYIPFELSKLHYPYYWYHLNKKIPPLKHELTLTYPPTLACNSKKRGKC